MSKKRVLFVCVHNSARSQMAEALANHFHGDVLQAESAGLEPTTINPLAVSAMSEIGLDIAESETSSVFDRYRAGEMFDYIVTVCAETEDNCPVFPGIAKRLHMPFDNPEDLQGSDAERLEGTRTIRESIRKAVAELARKAQRASA